MIVSDIIPRNQRLPPDGPDGADGAGESERIENCRTRIASYKKPSRIEFVRALPSWSPQSGYEKCGLVDRACFGGTLGGDPLSCL